MVTLSLAALMVIVTDIWKVSGICVPACQLDWHTSFGLTMFVLWPVINQFVHASFIHLVGNLVAFVFLGTLVETWMVHVSRRRRYYILLATYLLGASLTLVEYSVGGVSSGSSTIIYMLLPVVLGYWLKFRTQTSRLLSLLIIAGLAFLLVEFGYTIVLGARYPTFQHGWGLYYGFLIAGWDRLNAILPMRELRRRFSLIRSGSWGS